MLLAEKEKENSDKDSDIFKKKSDKTSPNTAKFRYLPLMFHATESDEIPGDFYSHRYPFCDVFVMRQVLGQFVLRSKCGFNAWPSEVYSRQFRPADLQLVCPGQPELYLAATYGSGWASVGATDFFSPKSAGLLRQETWQLAAVGEAAGPGRLDPLVAALRDSLAQDQARLDAA